jgi:hypothetical protein
VFNFISIILEISSLVSMATAAAAVSGVIYVIQVVYLIFSLCGLSGVYQNCTALVQTAVVGYIIKGFLAIFALVMIGVLGDDIDLAGTDPTVLVVAGLISKCE